MNKYQEAYELECEREHIIDLILDKYPVVQMEIYENEKYEKNIKKMKFFEKKYKHLPCGVIQELIDQTKDPTLEECIKEWEALGYKVDITNREIEFTHLKSIKYISIDRKSKTYWCPFYLSLEEHQLITKTFKALGWM